MKISIQVKIFLLNQQNFHDRITFKWTKIFTWFSQKKPTWKFRKIEVQWQDLGHVNPRSECDLYPAKLHAWYYFDQSTSRSTNSSCFHLTFHLGFQIKNHLWRHQSVFRAKGLALYSTDVYGFFDIKFITWTRGYLFNRSFEVMQIIVRENERF